MPDRNTSAMTDSPDREFEIVLGNKQLFSLLFIVFVLLGVFFAMGYLMGRNTLPVDTAAAGSRTPVRGEASDGTVSTRPSASSSIPETTTATSQTPVEPEPTPPARTAEEVTRTAPRTAAPEKSKPAAEPPPSALTVVEPKPGQTFLQVSAITRAEAELLVEVLQKKGFRAILAPGPKSTLR